jgi:hypothetical protein
MELAFICRRVRAGLEDARAQALVRPAIKRGVRLLQTVHRNVAAIEAVGPPEARNTITSATSWALPRRSIGKPSHRPTYPL